MSIPLILEKVWFLRGVLNPDWVDGNPGQPGPIYRVAIADYAIAEIARSISQNLSNRELGAKLAAAGRELAQESAKGLMSSYDEGDDICPPWYWNKPIPHPHDTGPWSLDPVPVPWLQHLNPALNDVLLATALRQLASLTTNVRASALMKEIGEAVVKGASSRMYDEYCGTAVKPRIPAPKPKATAA
jgi:hypothetical protein